MLRPLHGNLILDADVYAGHLAHLGAKSPVKILHPLVFDDGVIFAPAGINFDFSVATQMRERRLAYPLELSVELEVPLSVDQLKLDLAELHQQEPFYTALQEHKPFLEQLQSYAEALVSFPVLRQKLQVMAHSMTWLYWRSLGAATLSYLIADEMRLPQAQKRELFWAGLAHDIGMLHVDPGILTKQTKLSAEDWFYIQRHVQIAVELLALDAELTSGTLESVREHHERCDGTGYPNASVESELSLGGQVLGLADSVVAIYCNRYRDNGSGWQEVIPVIEMSESQFLYRSVNILKAIVQRSQLPMARVVSGSKMHEFLANFLVQCKRMKHWFDVLQRCLLEIGFTHGDKQLHSMQNVLFHLATAHKNTEMCKPEFQQRIEILLELGVMDLPKEVGDACIQQQEVNFHLLRLSRMMQHYLTEGGCADAEITAVLERGFVEIREYLDS